MRKYGTATIGVRTPIIEKGDDLVGIAVQSTIDMAKQVGLTLSNDDVLGITETVVAKAQGNYATIHDIGFDIYGKFAGQEVGIVHPIMSRNRFQTILQGIAQGAKRVYVQLDHKDEQGNALSSRKRLFKPDTNFYTAEQYYTEHGRPQHSITKQNYIKLYQDLGDNIDVVVGSDPADMLNITQNIIVGTVHSRDEYKDYMVEQGANRVHTLSDILSSPINGSGYNPQYGVLGSNKANGATIKLFPRDCDQFVRMVQDEFVRRIGVSPEVMVYGDGAYKDPSTGIWELADPVVSPGFTDRLGQVGRGDTKLKNVADEHLAGMTREDKEIAMREIIKENQMAGGEGQLGTTPRKVVDLLGSGMDLNSGSGNKGTPLVLTHGYFDTFADEQMYFGLDRS